MYESLSPVQTDEIIAVFYATYAVAKRKPERNSGRERKSGLYGIGTLDLCDTGAALHQLS